MAGLWTGPIAASMAGPYAAALVAAFALFGAPGWLFCDITGLKQRISRLEAPALYFTCSLGLLVVPLCLVLATGGSLSTAVPYTAMGIATLTGASLATGAWKQWRSSGKAGSARTPQTTAGQQRSGGTGDPATAQQESNGRGSRLGLLLLLALTGLLLIALAYAGWKITTTGSIDRWWYLAYIRSYLSAPVLHLNEPFLTGQSVSPRFAFSSWLLSLALWSHCAGVDPIWLYERACPLLLTPLAFSAALLSANALFGRGVAARLAVLAGGLLWVGSLLPVPARLPEDKLFAALIPAPVVIGLFLYGVRRGARPWIAALLPAAAALATSHALVYAFTLLVLGPYALLSLATGPRRVRSLAALSVVIALGATYPAYTGFATRALMAESGAKLESPNHPVVRIHQNRDRLLDLVGGGYIVDPRLIRHPLCLLALAFSFLAFKRPRHQRNYLIPATVIPLAFSFVPPLPAIAGQLILPWMVYRLLWMLPFAALVAVAAERAWLALGKGAWLVPLVLALLTVPTMKESIELRTNPWRSRLALPSRGAVRDAFRAVAELPHDSIIAAAPELSERIPALSGRHVLAATDRTTIVFSSSRQRGETRLRTRAAIMNGLWPGPYKASRPDYLKTGLPTHLLIEPGSPAARYCGRSLFREEDFELCTFAPDASDNRDRAGSRIRSGIGNGAGSANDGRTSAGAGSNRGTGAGTAGNKAAGNSKQTPPLIDSPGHDFEIRLSLYDLLEHDSEEFPASCRPKPAMSPSHLTWPRPGPWSAAIPRTLCSIGLGRGDTRGHYIVRRITVSPFLGRAVDEMLVSIALESGGVEIWSESAIRRAAPEDALDFGTASAPADKLKINIASGFLPFVKLYDIEIGIDRIKPGTPTATLGAEDGNATRRAGGHLEPDDDMASVEATGKHRSVEPGASTGKQAGYSD